MIIDHLNNAALYYGLSKRIETGLRFLGTADLENLPVGRHDIKGNELFAILSEYTTKAHDSGQWEAHRRYIDIQYVVRGVEAIDYQSVSKLVPVSQYNEKDDALLLRGSGSRLVVDSGNFVIFLPQDAHRPGMSVRRPRIVRKVVVKALAN